jgi:UDP-2,3-diacylglucosamine pyrophosphatase LpxH
MGQAQVKNAVSFIGDYEAALSNEARRHGVDGIICGHIHHASSTTSSASAT